MNTPSVPTAQKEEILRLFDGYKWQPIVKVILESESPVDLTHLDEISYRQELCPGDTLYPVWGTARLAINNKLKKARCRCRLFRVERGRNAYDGKVAFGTQRPKVPNIRHV